MRGYTNTTYLRVSQFVTVSSLSELNWLRWNLTAWALTMSCNALRPNRSCANRNSKSTMLTALSRGRITASMLTRR